MPRFDSWSGRIIHNHMKHPNTVEKYPGSLAELAREIGNMHYASVAEFLQYLADDLKRQAASDREKGRTRLPAELEAAAEQLYAAKRRIDSAAEICKPHIREQD